MTSYAAIKLLHLAAVVLSFSLFVLRGVWMMVAPAYLQQRWVRVMPHVIDTVLLGAGIGLMVMTRQYPLAQPWLTAKLLALIAYIVLGSLALKRARSRRGRVLAFVAALAMFAYMVAVALTRSLMPW